ncbi:hypothetical protein COOONC_00488 [Cooperia oncophora]
MLLLFHTPAAAVFRCRYPSKIPGILSSQNIVAPDPHKQVLRQMQQATVLFSGNPSISQLSNIVAPDPHKQVLRQMQVGNLVTMAILDHKKILFQQLLFSLVEIPAFSQLSNVVAPDPHKQVDTDG